MSSYQESISPDQTLISGAREAHPGHAIASANPGSAGRQLLEVGAGDAVQLAREHAADGGLLLVCPVLQHVDVMPRQPDAQLRGADGLGEDAIPVGAERLFDDVQRPDLAVALDCKVTALVSIFDKTDLPSTLP